MDKLKEILDNINSKNLDNALSQCNEYEKDSNYNNHLISNFKGVIYFLKKVKSLLRMINF